MARVNFNEQDNNVSSLAELVTQYAEDKGMQDFYATKCKEENEQIKMQFEDRKLTEYTAGGVKVKKVIQHKESVNEAKMLEVLHKHGLENLIRTKEYVDMDALELLLYDNSAPSELSAELANCITTSEIVTLRLSKVKEPKK